jgi:IclR family acetate operon transcriptional repressor
MMHLVTPPSEAPDAANGPKARTLLRGLALLELLAEGHDGSVTRLARAAELDKGTASRLLATLRDARYVRQGPDRQYHLTGKVLGLADGYARELDLRALAHPWLTEMRDSVDETIHLGVMEGEQVIYIDKLESRRSLRLVSKLGHVEPASTTALGRAMLSRLPREQRERWVASSSSDAGIPVIQDAGAFLRLLDECEARGYAVDREENDEGVACVGAAIIDARGTPVAALSCSGPAPRILKRLRELGQLCQETAAEISAELAGQRPSPSRAETVGDGRRRGDRAEM